MPRYPFALLSIAHGLVACASSSAQPGQDSGRSDAVADASSDAFSGTDDVVGEGPEPFNMVSMMSGLPLPPGVAPPRRIFDSRAELTGYGKTSCSHQEPASGTSDRWCAFRLPGATDDTAELWVINVTIASTGDIPPCDGTSPACLRLTQKMWKRYANQFEGDTLIFYTDPVSLPTEPFVGSAHAWRPGWSHDRPLAARAILCSGHPHAAAVLCLSDPAGDPKNPDSVELDVGLIDDPEGAALPALGGRFAFRTDGSAAWQVGFSPSGELFAVSSPEIDPLLENLSVVATRDAGTVMPREVLRDLRSWTISRDGQKIYLLTGEKGKMTLGIADFPDGTNAATVASDLIEYLPVGNAPDNDGLLFRSRVDAGQAFQLLRPHATSPGPVTLFSSDSAVEGVLVAPDLSVAAWVDFLFIGRVIRVDDLSSCTINTPDEPSISALSMLDNAGLVFWNEPALLHPWHDGFYAPPDRCREKQRFSENLGFLNTVGHRGLIFGDELFQLSNLFTLKYAAARTDGTRWSIDEPVRIHEHVKPPVTLVGSDTTLVVFQAAPGEREPAGIFVFGPVPF
jgi:hypothetical protein